MSAQPLVDDEDLMLRYAAGDQAAFAQLYGRHKDRLWRYVLRLSVNEAKASDVFQDVWAQVISARSNYQSHGRFGPWLYKIAHNRVTDDWRSQRPESEWDEALGLSAPDYTAPANRALQAEQGSALIGALHGLPAPQREAFLLQAEGGLSLDEIALTQGVGRETVKSRLRYALATLKKELAHVWP